MTSLSTEMWRVVGVSLIPPNPLMHNLKLKETQ